MLSAQIYHIAVLLIYGLGIYNLLTTKNIVKIVLVIEMMLAATNLLLLQAAVRNGNDPLGHAVLITSIVIGAGLSAFLLSATIKTYREEGGLDISNLSRLRG